jgi:hypothetical protein
VCAHANLASWTSSDADAAAMMKRVWPIVFGRAPTTDELSGFAATLPSTDATTATAICNALLRTNPYLFY